MKIISFSLWGSAPMYSFGAVENIKLAREIYPDWQCRFYIDDTVPQSSIDAILKEGGVVFSVGDKRGNFWGMFWRFFANDDPEMEVVISRDCDSRLSLREKVAVDEWLLSDKCFHTMHDHYGHRSVPILGGMWGAKKGCIGGMIEKVMNWGDYANKGIDQMFLAHRIWPLVRDNSLNHSSIHNRWASSVQFPSHGECKFGVKYVGEIFDENNRAIVS